MRPMTPGSHQRDVRSCTKRCPPGTKTASQTAADFCAYKDLPLLSSDSLTLMLTSCGGIAGETAIGGTACLQPACEHPGAQALISTARQGSIRKAESRCSRSLAQFDLILP